MQFVCSFLAKRVSGFEAPADRHLFLNPQIFILAILLRYIFSACSRYYSVQSLSFHGLLRVNDCTLLKM